MELREIVKRVLNYRVGAMKELRKTVNYRLTAQPSAILIGWRGAYCSASRAPRSRNSRTRPSNSSQPASDTAQYCRLPTFQKAT